MRSNGYDLFTTVLNIVSTFLERDRVRVFVVIGRAGGKPGQDRGNHPAPSGLPLLAVGHLGGAGGGPRSKTSILSS